MLERLKSIVIITLIIIVLYQVFDLWGDNNITGFWDKSFFSVSKEEKQYLTPNNIFISSGDKKFFEIKDDTIQNELITEYTAQIYKAIFESKISYEIEKTSFVELVNNRSIILIYDDYEYDLEIFEELFKITNDKIKRELNCISRVIIYPNSSDITKTTVYIQDIENKILRFELKLDTVELYGLIDEINMFEVTNVFLLSENYSFKKYFKKIEFIPAIINSKNLINHNYKIFMPFSSKENQTELIEQYANLFFENPRAKWKMEKEENMTLFGDGEKTVRIYEDGYIQYNNVAINDEKSTLEDAENVALKMIEKDMYISNNLKLMSVKKINNNTYELGYKYVANGIDVDVSKKLLDKYRLKYPITIEVTGHKVTEYRGIILEFQNEEENLIEYDIVPYDEILDDVVLRKGEKQMVDMKLSYCKTLENDDTKIMWVVIFDDEELTFDAIR